MTNEDLTETLEASPSAHQHDLKQERIGFGWLQQALAELPMVSLGDERMAAGGFAHGV